MDVEALVRLPGECVGCLGEVGFREPDHMSSY